MDELRTVLVVAGVSLWFVCAVYSLVRAKKVYDSRMKRWDVIEKSMADVNKRLDDLNKRNA